MERTGERAGRTARALPSWRRGAMAAAVLGVLACLAPAALAAAPAPVSFVFVRPRPAAGVAEARTLRDVAVVNVRGGRALAFDEVAPGQDARVDAVRAVVASSRAVARALELWGLARSLAPEGCQKWMAAAGPVPLWVQPPDAPPTGPALQALLPVRVLGPSGRVDAAQVLTLADLKVRKDVVVTVPELAAAGLLVPMLAHECFHGLQADLYRERYLTMELLGGPRGAHDSPDQTDPCTALKEGVAEAGELWLGQLFEDEVYPSGVGGARPEVVELQRRLRKRRLELAARGRYVFAADGRVKDGRLDSGAADLATEGVIASLTYTLLAHGNMETPWESLFRTMAVRAPPTFFDLAEGLVLDLPDQAATVQRILLEYTNYTVRSDAAAALYQGYYLAKKAFVQGRQPREAFERAREVWERFKDEQYEAVRGGAFLGAAVPQPLLVETRDGRGLDLNDRDVERLAWFMEPFLREREPAEAARTSKLYALRVAKRREEVVYLRSVDELSETLPGWLVEKFQAGHRRVAQKLQERLDKAVTARRTLAGS